VSEDASLPTFTVALVGRPNSGKTSLLMHLTGSAQRPVNFPGTSVERTESTAKCGSAMLKVVDLPGIVSLAQHSKDEAVTLDYLRGIGATPPDVVCAVLDAGKLPVELRLLQKILTLGRPVVVALTKLDVAIRDGRPVDVAQLQRALGLPLCVVDGFSGDGASALACELEAAAREASTSASLRDPELVAKSALRLDPRASSRTDRIDRVLLHPVAGPLALALVLIAMFQLVFAAAEPFVEALEMGLGFVGDGVRAVVPEGALQSFFVDGLVHGVGSSLVFVPQIALLMAFVTVLEASGYMARAVFLLDRMLRSFGLTGRSFVPLASSFACAIPGILASRILADERDRIATIVVAPLMSCSARLPVYVVLLAAFFEPVTAGFVLLALYLVGPLVAILVATLLRRTKLRGGHSPLAMELPTYQRPSVRVVWRQVASSVRQFLATAGSVILVATVVVWALSWFPRDERILAEHAARIAAVPAGAEHDAERERIEREQRAALLEASWLASIGKAVQPAFAPMGFDWRHTVGVLAAFPARELVVPTLAVLHRLGDVEADPEVADEGLTAALRDQKGPDGKPSMDWLVALSMMVFFALCSQCSSTLAAIRRETHSWKWPLFTFGYMTGVAWIAATAVYQIGSLLRG
jgi:ferrous iron transport protein B